MADERSVSVDERKEQPAPAERRPAVAAGIRLSPVQEAWQRYVRHSLRECPVCRCADGSPCDTAESLYRAYQEAAAEAAAQVAGKTFLPHGQ